MGTPSIVWFRLDLRLADHPALNAALEKGGEIIPVFIWAPEEEKPWPAGAASRWWLHQSLRSLQNSLALKDSRLILRTGSSLKVLQTIIQETGAKSVFWNRRYEPAVIERDSVIKTGLREQGIQTESFNGALLFEPWTIRNQQGNPYQVFTAYWNTCLAKEAPAKPLKEPGKIPSPKKWPVSLKIQDLNLEPKTHWAQGLKEMWKPGSAGAEENYALFLKQAVENYPEGRDLPAERGTSLLAPHLHFGEISPRRVWHDLMARKVKAGSASKRKGMESYLRQLVWREFSHYLLYHFPETSLKPLKKQFQNFPWKTDSAALKLWQKGKTGYPFVDAGMRELWHTGWMHNRVRMVAASFLVKDLFIPWQEGARWFWDTLADADLANNSMGWQWCAGCGADAAPFFRIFNPVSQGEKFDPEGLYVRKWVPELAKLPSKWIHKPFEAPAEILREAGIVLGKHYPKPAVDHAEARHHALFIFQKFGKAVS